MQARNNNRKGNLFDIACVYVACMHYTHTRGVERQKTSDRMMRQLRWDEEASRRIVCVVRSQLYHVR